jgi:hypothetical protein
VKLVERRGYGQAAGASTKAVLMIYGFDFDGTLVESWTATPLPGVRERLAALSRDAPC